MTVAQTMRKINKRIPGILPPPPKTEIDGKITDLSSKTVPELLELRDRQLKLLNNKAFVNKLADKGAKIQTLHDKIIQELKAKQDEEQACRLLDNLTLHSVDKQSVQNLEWKGKTDKSDTYLDSDDDSEPEDVLHILSQTTAHEKTIKTLPPEKPLVTPEDIDKIEELSHIKYLVEKTESNTKPKSTGNFKPYRTTKSDVHNPEKEVLRKRNKHWEVTAATPPPIIHGPAKVLSLDESLKLQTEYNTHLKLVEAQHAAEKLMARTGIKMPDLPTDVSSFGHYRDVENSDSDMEGSDKEVVDEEPEKGGVVFTVLEDQL